MALTNEGKRILKKAVDIQKYYDGTVSERIAVEERNKSRNLIRLLQSDRKEQEAADRQISNKEREAYRERSLEQEETLARELDELRRKEICEIRERQLLRTNSPELRELETKLRAAYTKRELQAQMAENEEKKRQEKLKIMQINKVLEEARLNEVEYHNNLKLIEITKKQQYKKELQDQIISNEKQKRYDYEEFLREKKRLDQVVERIHLEDQRTLQEKWLKMQKTKAEMESFKKAQEIWKQRQRERVDLENKKIQEYMYAKQSDMQAEVQKKECKDRGRQEMAGMVAQQLYEEKTRRKEREDIQQELLEQELIEAVELREQRDLEKRFRQRVEMIRGLDDQVREHEMQRHEMAKEEAYYKELMQKNFEEEERLGLMSAEKQRIRKIQLKKDLQDLITQRRQKYAEDMQIKLKLHEQEMQELAERNVKIEEERIRMLKEHAEHLIGYMPQGIIRKDDLQLLGEDLCARYKTKSTYLA